MAYARTAQERGMGGEGMKVHYCDKCRELIESDNYKNIYCTDKNKGKYWFETYELCMDCFTDFEKFMENKDNG